MKSIKLNKPALRLKDKGALGTGWSVFLSAILAFGALDVLLGPWGNSGPQTVWMIIATVIGLCVFYMTWRFCDSPWLKWGIRAALAAALVLAFGIVRLWSGLRLWINCLISGWNNAHQGGLPLFSVEYSKANMLAITVAGALLSGALAWITVSGRRLVSCGIQGMALLALMSLTGCISPFGAASYVCALIGLWVSMRGEAPSRQALRIWSFSAAVLFACAALAPTGEISFVAKLRSGIEQGVHNVRYGEDLLPMGDLRQAGLLNKENDSLLNVRSEQEKTLYLRGFVGSSYSDGVWSVMPDSAYGGEYSGMLDWLRARGFDPLTQSAEYYTLSDDTETPETNRIQVDICGANRYYMYAPASVQGSFTDDYKESKDQRILVRGFFGADSYSFDEISTVKPGELTVVAGWVSQPDTVEREQYAQSESVYRKFVYETYTAADPGLTEVLNGIFWKDHEPEHDGVYSDISNIRDKLRELTVYTRYPPENDGQDNDSDPIISFLTGDSAHRRGNAVMYAAAAVQALRCHGVPARYVEGYYLSSSAISASSDGTVTLTGQDAHAWAEIYFDGIGWLPVDVTPGYYYDSVTLQHMVSTPDAVRKKAVFDNSSDGISEAGGADGTKGSTTSEPVVLLGNIGMSILGIAAFLVVLSTLNLIILEALRIGIVYRQRRSYKRANAAVKARILRKNIFKILYLWGIDACMGWKVDAMDAYLADKFALVSEGEYRRIMDLLEKSEYGGKELEAFEIRTLEAFVDKITHIGKGREGRRMFWRLRYGPLFDFVPKRMRMAPPASGAAK